MWFTLAILIISTFLQGNPVKSQEQLRIVNGVLAGRGEFPYQISLQLNNAHDCGGSIINENFVLSAAHCVSGLKAEEFKIIAGTVNLEKLDDSATTHTVSKIIIHENYEQENDWNNDIALLQVNPPFKFNQYIKAVRLPLPIQTYRDNATATVSGFGYKGIGQALSTQLLKTNVHIVNQETCVAVHTKNTIRPTNICANNFEEKKGFCGGDSGGPLTVDGTIAGIVSWSFNTACAPTDKPQLYTRVSSYLAWITSHTIL